MPEIGSLTVVGSPQALARIAPILELHAVARGVVRLDCSANLDNVSHTETDGIILVLGREEMAQWVSAPTLGFHAGARFVPLAVVPDDPDLARWALASSDDADNATGPTCAIVGDSAPGFIA
jgi:hypothetical protein